jgi:DNA invertase Pin-like site-specific DNA recombinase
VTVKAFSYFRFSSAVQAQGDSLRRQLSAAMAWAAEHPEVELDTSLRDLGVSAYRGEHRVKGALASFLKMVEQGQIPRGSFFLIESFDRLSRESEMQAVNLLTGITLAGIRLVTLADGAIYDEHSDAMDLMRAIIVMSRAHEENKSRGRKVAAAWQDKKRRARETGEVLSKRGPSWVEFNGKSFDLIGDRAAIVRRMFEEAASGLGATAISSRLNAEGVKPFGKSDGWHAHFILTTLHNRSCIGEYQPTNWSKGAGGRARRTPDGEPIPNYYPPVVSEELFNRVQAVIFDRHRRGNAAGRRGKSFPNLLLGLARCEECGGSLGVHVANPNRPQGPILKCHAAARNHGCGNKRRYPTREIEECLIAFLARAKMEERDLPPESGALAEKIDSRAELLRRVDTLLDQVEAGVPFVEERLRRRQSELVALDREITGLKTAVLHAGQRRASTFVAAFTEVMSDLSGEVGDPYLTRAKFNAALIERFDWIMPLEGGLYALERAGFSVGAPGEEERFRFGHWYGRENEIEIEARLSVPESTQISRAAMDIVRGPIPL